MWGIVGHSPHSPHSFHTSWPSPSPSLSALCLPNTAEDIVALSFLVLMSGNKKMRNSAKPCHSSSRFMYWYVTSLTTLGLLKTARAPVILSVRTGWRPFLINTRKLIRLANLAILETRVKALRSPRWSKPLSLSDAGPCKLKPKPVNKLWDRSWSQRGPAVSTARPNFCLGDRGL